jgi:hypothetical protein
MAQAANPSGTMYNALRNATAAVRRPVESMMGSMRYL